MENDYLKNLHALVSQRQTEKKAQVISALKHKHKFAILLEVAKLPRASQYHRVKGLSTADKRSELAAEIQTIHHEHKGRCGYRRITLELHQRGYTVNHKTVQHLMQQYGIVCRVRVNEYCS